MKWQLVLKVESRKGDTEEHVIGTGYGPLQALRTLVKEKEEHPHHCRCFLKPKQQKDILKNTQDVELVTFILNTTDIDLNESMLEQLFERFNSIDKFQCAIICYCYYNKKGLYNKFKKMCTTPLALHTIQNLDLKTKNGT